MVRGGRGGRTSAEWRACCICLVLLLQFLLFSTGSAIRSSKENSDHIVSVDDSSIAASQLRSTANSNLALKEVHHSRSQDLLSPDVVQNSHAYYSRTGLWNLVRRFIVDVITKHQFYSAAFINSWPVEALHDQYHYRHQQRLGLKDENHDVTSSSGSTSTNRRLMLRGPGRSSRRSSSLHYFWALKQQQRERRRVMEEASSSPAGQQTQQMLLGPPAPPGLVHNEKQDWNQDYAEPDVHPPSSN